MTLRETEKITVSTVVGSDHMWLQQQLYINNKTAVNIIADIIPYIVGGSQS